MEHQDSSWRLLALASLFKEEFSIDWLAELTDQKPSQIFEVIEKGLQLGWLTQKKQGIFYFTNRSKKKSLRDSFSSQEKEQWHRRLAYFLSNSIQDDQTKAKEIAVHLHYIPEGLERAKCFLKVGDMERGAYKTEEALQCYKKALDNLRNEHTEEADDLFIQTAIRYSKLTMARHDTQQVMTLLQEAMDRAGKKNRQEDLTLLKMHLAKNEWLSGRAKEAFILFEEAWAQAQTIDNPALFRAASAFRIFFFYWQGRFKEAVSCYEQSVSEVERLPLSGFSVLGLQMAGFCYALCGQPTQGLGMLDAIRSQYRNKGDVYLALYAEQAIAHIFMAMGRLDESIELFEKVVVEAKREHVSWVYFISKFGLALCYLQKGNIQKSRELLQTSLDQSREVHVNIIFAPILLDFCWAIETGQIPKLNNLDLDQEIQRQIESGNLYCQGVAYRYRAFLQERRGSPPKTVIQLLEKSLGYLEESGHQMEISHTLIELTRRQLIQGYEKKAENTARQTWEVFAAFNPNGFPEDLKFLIRDDRPQRENLLEEILRLSQETATIRDSKELVHHIISTVNRITGAERGAIFMLKGETKGQKRLDLKASRNLTQEEILSPDFRPSMKMIESVARTGLGQIKNESPRLTGPSPGESIRSCVCVPLIIQGKVSGVLYHDNRLLSNAFGDSDLEFLSYFAAQAAIALNNSQAYLEIQLESEKLREEKQYYEEERQKILHFEDFIGQSSAIGQVFSQVDQVASTETTVVITGETGVGKDLVASRIHRLSRRADKPFIRVQCTTLPESLIPSELFGHEKGAFTGAIGRRIGRFELADGGTLFLDEIGELSLEVQVRLLRVLQTKEFERVGGTKTIHSDFRLIAATNRDLETLVQKGQFRADLYYRINVFPIKVPPLRERKEDIPLLANYFLKIHGAKMNKKFKNLSNPLLDHLCRYNWPGNVRELENVIERGAIRSTEPDFLLSELEIAPSQQEESKTGLTTLKETLREAEHLHIQRALQNTGWRVSGPGGAAELLDLQPSTLEFRMKKLGIKRPSEVVIRRASRYIGVSGS
ncbi:MAG: sigma 54-interacting transcriptional regulator [Deltaproteobacteria bacterium]|nr:sigma 54-interacting transcriptional regulator [Deltaproteobacteria bacterium]